MSHYRKSHEVVGAVGDAELLCVDCATPEQLAGSPVFLDGCEPGDYCAACLNKWIHETEPEERKDGASSWVYLDGEGPQRE